MIKLLTKNLQVLNIQSSRSVRFNNINYFIIAILLFVVVYFRYLTEIIVIFPRVFQTADIGIIFIQIIMLIALPKTRTNKNIAKLISIILFLIAISTLINLNDVHLLAVFLFIIFLIEPLVLYMFILKSKLSLAHIRNLLIFVFIAFLIQIVLGITQIPQAMSYSPDFLAGTFGYGYVQMLFFMCTFVYFLFALYLKNQSNLFLWVIPIISILFLVASVRMTWVMFPLVLVYIYWITNKHVYRKNRQIKYYLLFLFISIFVYNIFSFFALEAGAFYSLANNEIDITQFGLYRGFEAISELYGDQPISILVGSGPATFSSRAMEAFVGDGNARVDVASSIIGGNYNPAAAAKYISSKYGVYLGSYTLASPRSSYTSFIAEMGVIATLLYLLIYWRMFKRLNMIQKQTKNPLTSSLALASMGAILFLAEMSLFGDWFSVSRVTLITWFFMALSVYLYELELEQKIQNKSSTS